MIRVEDGKFADQKYLDEFPRLFSGVAVCQHPGVNLAPWNWMNCRYRFSPDQLQVDGQALIVCHFALFKPRGRFLFDSGQIEYGVMPLRLRSWLYGRYFMLLEGGTTEGSGTDPGTAATSGPWASLDMENLSARIDLWIRVAAGGSALDFRIDVVLGVFQAACWCGLAKSLNERRYDETPHRYGHPRLFAIF